MHISTHHTSVIEQTTEQHRVQLPQTTGMFQYVRTYQGIFLCTSS